MKSFLLKKLSSFLFLFLILNQDIIISAHSLRFEKSLLTLKSEIIKHHKKKQNSTILHQNNSTSISKNSDTSLRLKDKETSKFDPFGVFFVIIVVSYVANRIVKAYLDYRLQKAKKWISKEKHKIHADKYLYRIDESSIIINYCLDYQKFLSLFKSYSILQEIHDQEFQKSLKELKKSGKSIKLIDFLEKTAKPKVNLNKYISENCFNTFQQRVDYDKVVKKGNQENSEPLPFGKDMNIDHIEQALYQAHEESRTIISQAIGVVETAIPISDNFSLSKLWSKPSRIQM